MKQTKRMTVLMACALLTVAGAERLPNNLKGFKSVCVSGSYSEKGKENDAVLNKLFDKVLAALAAAKVPVNNDPDCLKRGTSQNKQLNLYFNYDTIESGEAMYASLEGWLDREGPYTTVTLWQDYFFGTLDAGSGALDAADTWNDLVKDFIADWKKVSH